MKAALIILCFLAGGCSSAVRNVCTPVCNDDKPNYVYRLEYADPCSEDYPPILTGISSSTRFTMRFDNESRLREIDTAPDAPTGLLRSAWDQISKFVGNIAGSIF